MQIDYEAADTPVPVADAAELRTRYETLTALVMRQGNWLSGPAAQLLPPDEWEQHFAQYQQHLVRLKELGDALRPVTLRDRYEPLNGDEATAQVMELFSA